MKPIKFKTGHRAKFSQIDPYGVMHNQYYLEYFMDHRMMGLRENLGWDLKALQALPVLFIVKSVQIEFQRPVRGDEEFTIESKVEEFKGVSCVVSCQMQSPQGKDLAKCLMTIVAVDAKTLKPTEWPRDISEKFFSEVEQ